MIGSRLCQTYANWNNLSASTVLPSTCPEGRDNMYGVDALDKRGRHCQNALHACHQHVKRLNFLNLEDCWHSTSSSRQVWSQQRFPTGQEKYINTHGANSGVVRIVAAWIPSRSCNTLVFVPGESFARSDSCSPCTHGRDVLFSFLHITSQATCGRAQTIAGPRL